MINLYHGTNLAFEKFDQRFARSPNDYYGGGIAYFTDSEKVARGYAEARYTQYKGVRLAYYCDLNFTKTFDVDDVFTGQKLLDLVKLDKTQLETFARNAGLLNSWYLKENSIDKYDVFSRLLDGSIKLTGDEVFLGLSKNKTAQDQARDYLITKGYDSLRYNGGEQVVSRNFGKHNVYIAYRANQITILKKFW